MQFAGESSPPEQVAPIDVRGYTTSRFFKKDHVVKSLNHFSIFRFTDEYWRLDAAARNEVQHTWREGLEAASEVVHCYQLFPTESRSDVMVWSAIRPESDDGPKKFFEVFATATAPHRRYVEPTVVLWGRRLRRSSRRSRRGLKRIACSIQSSKDPRKVMPDVKSEMRLPPSSWTQGPASTATKPRTRSGR